MSILRIRENFISTIHGLDSITNYEGKWKGHLFDFLENASEFSLKCDKIDSETNCIEIKKDGNDLHINTSYLIGLDFLSEDLPFIVEPKFEDENKEYTVDFYDILFKSLPFIKSSEDISDLYFVDLAKPTVEINHKDDFLTPILVIQFLTYLDKICHLGLQKGYYWIEKNIENKVKGKILLKETIKYNHLKSNYTKTYCRYQEFGINTQENQFLKFTFKFCLNYLNQFDKLKLIDHLESKLGFIRSSLEKVDAKMVFKKELSIRKNPIFPIYENALKLANLILKKISFNITITNENMVKTYPYWINMSKLFEIHILSLLRNSFKEGIYYQKRYAERIPDIIINRDDFKAVIDVKYKPYLKRSIEIEDIRQVAAYVRMKPIFQDLNLDRNDILDAIIIYPSIESNNKELGSDALNKKKELKNYFNIFELDVAIPIIQKD